jgi:hypothetical protein
MFGALLLNPFALLVSLLEALVDRWAPQPRPRPRPGVSMTAEVIEFEPYRRRAARTGGRLSARRPAAREGSTRARG